MTDYVVILLRCYAGKEWWISGNDYDTLDWLSNSEKPSKATLDGLWASVQQEIANEVIAETSAREALLVRLGITADEAQLLLGA
jgi:hypothetical protein